MKYLAKLLLSVFLLTTTVSAQKYVNTLSSETEYSQLKGKPLSDKYSNIESVKVVYDLESKKIYYFNSTEIRLHFDFVTECLHYSGDLYTFNKLNYSANAATREFLLGNLNHIKNTDKWILELAASDHMNVVQTEFFYNAIMQSTFIGQKLVFFLNNREKLELFEQKAYKIPCVKSDYIFNELQYQEVVPGKAVGILKYYTAAELNKAKSLQNEIIILDETPEVLPRVKGIIVGELQTPLSHLVILGRNRKVPVMAFKKASEYDKIKNLIGQKVELIVKSDTFSIKKSNSKINVEKPLIKRVLPLDLSVTRLVDLNAMPKSAVNSIGSKAQNVAYLISFSKELQYKTPENAYAIPFYFYHQHLKQNNLLPLIDKLSVIPTDSTQAIKKQLKRIRDEIKKAPINASLIEELNRSLKQSEYTRFRFRSSTNAEDLPGFSGAGLYESKTGIRNDSIQSFEKAIKQVWASTWNESSYFEREWYGIDQKSIAMGVMVHRAFPDEKANGVVITKNLYRDNFTGITVNVQVGDVDVVKPETGEICEQFTVYDFDLFDENPDYEVDYVTLSNRNQGKPILTKDEINRLYKVCRKLEGKMYKIWKRKTFYHLDIEFKLEGEGRELYLKQVRPYPE